MLNLKRKEAQIKGRLKKRQRLSLIGFVILTASAIVAFYTFPSLSTAGWISIIFAFVTTLCWFLPIAMAAAEMATVRGWTNGGIFVWVRNMLGPRWGFIVNWLQFQVILGFTAIILFTLTSFSFADGGVHGYNLINSLKLGTTLLQPTAESYSTIYHPGIVFGCGAAVFAGIIMVALMGQKFTHLLSQFGFTLGILTPFLIVSGFGIYTVATMPDHLFFIGNTFEKNPPLSIGLFSNSYNLSKQFVSATVMASFMAFMFSVQGIECSAVAANRMRDPSRNYPRAMSIVVVMALICAILGAVVIAMTVPPSALSFTGGVIQYMLFTLSVAGVTVHDSGVVYHFHTLADAYSQIALKYGNPAADEMLNQFIYGPHGATLNQYGVDPANTAPVNEITGQVGATITASRAPTSFMDGIRFMACVTGFGTFVEMTVWIGNLSSGLVYAMQKNHFSRFLTKQLKNGAPVFLIFYIMLVVYSIFIIYIFGFSTLDAYQTKSITDVLMNVHTTGSAVIMHHNVYVNNAGLTAQQVHDVRNILQDEAYTHDPTTKGWVFNTKLTPHKITTILNQIKHEVGFMPVASGTTASQTSSAFISVLIMQIFTYFVAYEIFLSSYLIFIFKGRHLHRVFKIKSMWVEILFAMMVLLTNAFVSVATWLPSAPDLYPGNEAYFLFLEISLPIDFVVVLAGPIIYQINKLRARRLGFVMSEQANIYEANLEQVDLDKNLGYYQAMAKLSDQNGADYARMCELADDLRSGYDNVDQIDNIQEMEDLTDDIQDWEDELIGLQTKFNARNERVLIKQRQNGQRGDSPTITPTLDQIRRLKKGKICLKTFEKE